MAIRAITKVVEWNFIHFHELVQNENVLLRDLLISTRNQILKIKREFNSKWQEKKEKHWLGACYGCSRIGMSRICVMCVCTHSAPHL